MKPASLLAELRRRGVELSVAGDDLVYRAPKGSIPSELLATVKSHKLSIIDELKAENTEGCEFDNLSRLLDLEQDEQPLEHSYARHVEPVKSKLLSRVGLDIVYTKGDGNYLWDNDGNRYLDCISQYGALPFGYNPAEIWAAIEIVRKQQLPNVATQSMLDSAGMLAEKLLQCLPPQFENVVLTNSGAESIEVAIKLCRACKKRPGILSTQNGFHGLTTGSLAVTGSEGFQNGFFIRCQDFQYVPFGDIDALEQTLCKLPNHFSAFIVEPIQGEAGIVCPPSGYFQAVRQLCDRHDVLLVFDEVQTGLGRTGDMFAFEHEDVIPDVIALAKALGGGLIPCGAVVCQEHAYTNHFGLRHSSTFAGNAMASQCGIATLNLLTTDSNRLVRRVQSNGKYLSSQLEELCAKYSNVISSVRGRGYMQAIEFDFAVLEHYEGLLPVLANEGILLHLIISHLLHQHGIRLAPTFMGRNVIRIEPPLTFTRENCDQLVDALDKTLALLLSGNSAALVCHTIKVPSSRRSNIVNSGYMTESTASGVDDTNRAIDAQFGFLVHLTDLQDLIEFDRSLDVFDRKELADLKHQLTRSSEPTIIGSTDIVSQTGRCVRGHFVLVPYTPSELVQMESEHSVEQIRKAAYAASQENIELIGLGGFTSILTLGGVAIDDGRLPALTSGNAYTAAATFEAIEVACETKDKNMVDLKIGVVGAAGQIGRVVCQLLAKQSIRLMLIGRDGSDQRTQNSLSQLADELATTSPLEHDQIEIARSVDQVCNCDIVILVSSATEPFIKPNHIKPGAIVIDSSRPPNVSDEVKNLRADVTWIEGGLINLPGNPKLDLFAGPSPDAAYACVAETALWALEPDLGTPTAKRILDCETVQSLCSAAKKHGFKVIV